MWMFTLFSHPPQRMQLPMLAHVVPDDPLGSALGRHGFSQWQDDLLPRARGLDPDEGKAGGDGS